MDHKYVVIYYDEETGIVRVVVRCDDLEKYALRVQGIPTGYVIPASALEGAKKGQPFVAHDGEGWRWVFPPTVLGA